MLKWICWFLLFIFSSWNTLFQLQRTKTMPQNHYFFSVPSFAITSYCHLTSKSFENGRSICESDLLKTLYSIMPLESIENTIFLMKSTLADSKWEAQEGGYWVEKKCVKLMDSSFPTRIPCVTYLQKRSKTSRFKNASIKPQAYLVCASVICTSRRLEKLETPKQMPMVK